MKKRISIIVSCFALLVGFILSVNPVKAIDVGAGIETGDSPVAYAKKEVKNISTTDGINRVGDTLEYTITLSNNGPFSTWKNINVVDTLPTGIDFQDTFPVLKDDAVATYAYNSSNRELSLTIDKLSGDDKTLEGVIVRKDVVKLKFRATINKTAAGKTIVNSVEAFGESNIATTTNDPGVYVDPIYNPGANVTVNYQDTDGKALASPTQLVGNLDDPFTVQAKTFAGYKLKETIGATSGIFTKDPQSVTFVYQKVAVAKTEVKQDPPTKIKTRNSTLPQTGESNNGLYLMILGLVVIALTILIKRRSHS